MPRRFLLLGLAGLGLACGTEADGPAVTRVTPEATERYRTGAVVELLAVDREIAALETAAEGADSAAAVAYGRTLEALRRERQAVQTGLDTLQRATTATFEAATDTLDRRIERLAGRVERAPLELAQDAAGLRQVALARLAALEAEAQEDPGLLAAQGELVQRRQQIEGELARLGGEGVSFPAVRARVVQQFEALAERVDALREAPAAPIPAAPTDTTVAPAPPVE